MRASDSIVEDRIEHIEGLMRRAAWDRGRTSRALAHEWGCSLASVNDYASRAGRRVRDEVTDTDEVTLTVSAALSTIVREALAEGDRTSVIKAADTWTRIVGARAPEKVEDVTASKQRPLAEQIAIAESVVEALKSQGQ